MSKKTVFISYSQKDKDRVSLFASVMAKIGYDIWMDVKNISLGDHIISAIAEGLDSADIYMLFLSHNSINSSWVTEELNIALTKSIENRKLQIIPVLLDDCTIPSTLTGRLYLDARQSIQSALNQLRHKFQQDDANEATAVTVPNIPILTGVIFGLSKETDISIGPFCEGFTRDDLISNREQVQRLLRMRANGILMNFVPLSDFDLQSPIPKFKNGVYDESITTVGGDTAGSICEKVMAKTTVFNPDANRLDELVRNRLNQLCVTSLVYIFSLPFQESDFDRKCMQRIQDNYSIISYDFEDGATIEFANNFFVSVKCTPEQIQIKLQTQYDFTFSEQATSFSPMNFIEWLINGT